LHQGVSTEWRQINGAWIKHTRVLPADRLVLSSYEFRRDVTVFRPSEEMLELFENLSPQGNWRLDLPRSANNLEYEAISDVKLVLYFDAEFSEALAAHIKTFYPPDGGRTLILSSRFHFPDQYFRLGADRKLAFSLPQWRFAFNHAGNRVRGLAVRIVPKLAATAGGIALRVTRASDGSFVEAVTNAHGVVQGDPTTMQPFGAWHDTSAVDTFTVSFGEEIDTSAISDVEFALDYRFTYRPDGTLAA
jgi:hypothetical protein